MHKYIVFHFGDLVKYYCWTKIKLDLADVIEHTQKKSSLIGSRKHHQTYVKLPNERRGNISLLNRATYEC